jgi:threonine synthase
MKYYNINNKTETVPLKEAVLRSLSRVGDLYLPEKIPQISSGFFDSMHCMNLQEIALEVSKAFLGEDVPDRDLESIVKTVLNFEIPLRQLDDDLYVLELFHGPTLAFKDVGARFMASLFEYLIRDENREITILVATSGDTGSAVANAFYNKKGIKVIILYPAGKVSALQEKQLTTMGGNITAFKVDGTFDDCQRLVKLAFADPDLNKVLNLTSANSINFARLFPQSFYYYHAVARLKSLKKPVVISVPSGNYGNLTAGLIAKKTGLIVHKFIASANRNHAVTDYLESGRFVPNSSLQTITNAMDVGNPSNFPRILDLFNNRHDIISNIIKGYWYTDDHTREALRELFNKFEYQADPHGAVGYLGLREYLGEFNGTGIFLETAHPAKFSEEVEKATGRSVPFPEELKKLDNLKMNSTSLPNDFGGFKDVLGSYGG